MLVVRFNSPNIVNLYQNCSFNQIYVICLSNAPVSRCTRCCLYATCARTVEKCLCLTAYLHASQDDL